MEAKLAKSKVTKIQYSFSTKPGSKEYILKSRLDIDLELCIFWRTTKSKSARSAFEKLARLFKLRSKVVSFMGGILDPTLIYHWISTSAPSLGCCGESSHRTLLFQPSLWNQHVRLWHSKWWKGSIWTAWKRSFCYQEWALILYPNLLLERALLKWLPVHLYHSYFASLLHSLLPSSYNLHISHGLL